MNATPTDPNTQKAVTFFTQAGLARLLTKLRDKYIELGQVGGQVLLQDSTANERRELASFLGRPPYHQADIKVRLADMDKALRKSGFACTLPDLLSTFFPDQPLITRPEQRRAIVIRQTDFHAALLSIATALPEDSRGKHWLLQGLHGQEWLFSRYKNLSEEEQQQQLTLIRYIASVLDQLPSSEKPERLALFAQRTSGDPHTLDPDRVAGRLFLLALGDLYGQRGTLSTPLTAIAPQDRPQQLRLYSKAGLLVDTISSSVAVFNLAGAVYHSGAPDPLVQAAGQRVLLLPLRQVLEWQSISPARADIYVFENPQVFEEVALREALESGVAPTLVCTSGWPSVAALRVLDLLLAQSPVNCLYYSGDFDLKGLQIAAHLMARYPGHCQPWRFDTDSYTMAMQADGVPARESELALLHTLPDTFIALVAIMQEKKKWAYQEGITHLLTEDVRKNHV